MKVDLVSFECCGCGGLGIFVSTEYRTKVRFVIISLHLDLKQQRSFFSESKLNYSLGKYRLYRIDFSVYRIDLRCVSKRLYMCIETTSICIETTGYPDVLFSPVLFKNFHCTSALRKYLFAKSS